MPNALEQRKCKCWSGQQSCQRSGTVPVGWLAARCPAYLIVLEAWAPVENLLALQHPHFWARLGKRSCVFRYTSENKKQNLWLLTLGSDFVFPITLRRTVFYQCLVQGLVGRASQNFLLSPLGESYE